MRKATNTTPRNTAAKAPRKTATAKAAAQTAGNPDQVIDPVTGKTIQPDDVRPWSYDTMKARLAAFKMPTWVRTIMSWIGGILTWGTSYYLGMGITLQLATWVLVLTGSGLLTFLTIILGYVISQLTGIYAGLQMHGFIKNFDGGKAAASMAAMPGKITGWFGRVKSAAQAV